jgi:uncharacterized protein (TIGR01732 family)
MRREPSFPHAERGIALIVTLFILLVITFMGLIAMRTGLLQVAMSTNSQVNVLLFQNADAGTGRVEATINGSATYANGPGGPITLIKDNPKSEVVGCLTKTGLKLATSTVAPRTCDLDLTDERVSGREVVAVQVALRSPLDASGKAQAVVNYGTDDQVLPGGGGTLVAVYSTSVMPAYGSATSSTIETCLAKPQDYAVETVTDCLTNANASFQTVVQEFVYGYGGYKN